MEQHRRSTPKVPHTKRSTRRELQRRRCRHEEWPPNRPRSGSIGEGGGSGIGGNWSHHMSLGHGNEQSDEADEEL